MKENLTIMKCNHVKFLNSAAKKLRSCQTSLSEKLVLLNDQILIQTEKTFSFASIRRQLESMYSQLDFKRLL